MVKKAIFLLVSATLIPIAGHAGSFDLVSGFQGINFTYGYTATLGGTFNPYTVIDTTSHPGVTALLRNGTFTPDPPYAAYNTTGAPLNIGLSFLIPDDELDLHPGSLGEDTVVRFTAPSAGDYSAIGEFTGLDSASTDVHVLHNGVSLYDGNVSGSGSVQAYNVLATLAAGDTLDFVVGYGNGTYFNDSTGLEGVVSSDAVVATPEPGSLLILGTGLTALAGVRRRLRRGRS